MARWGRTGGWAAVAACAVLGVGCSAVDPASVGCTEIGSAAGISVTVERDVATPDLELTLRICQDACVDRRVDLQPGSTTVDETCSSDDPDGSCSASSSPDGTLIGFVDLAALTVGDAQVSGDLRTDGDSTPLTAITANVVTTYPNGQDCPAGGPQASVRITGEGLR